MGALEEWHRIVEAQDLSALPALLADDAVFHSPIVHTPQKGRDLVMMYLTGASQILFNGTFKYLKETKGDHCAVLEFQAVVDGLTVNGVDIISWNDEGQITEFKVMVRPLKATNLLHAKMKALIEEFLGKTA
jgi:hypothetical protein